ncbi:hypothetical protein IPG36_06070 [bacterium]|nr:MAG: hypothetical protein IPG36_06070 [bacterium]
MTTIETILVIMLGVGFFILLVLSIVIASLVVVIVRRINRLSVKAETATENISSAAAMVGTKLAPVAISTLLGLVAKKMKSRK